MNEGVRRRLPSPAMIVAIVGLVVALTGSAVALQGKNSVKSNDIAPNAVKGKDIASNAVKSRQVADGKITAPKLDVFKTQVTPEEVSTTSTPAADLGGPSVTVTVPPTAWSASSPGSRVGRPEAARAHSRRCTCSSPPSSPARRR